MSAALTLPNNVNPETIAWAKTVFLNLVDRECVDCPDMSASATGRIRRGELLERSRHRGIALQSAGNASAVRHLRRADKNGIDFTKSFF